MKAKLLLFLALILAGRFIPARCPRFSVLLFLALVLSSGLFGCSRMPIHQAHGISLSESETQIRASILKNTPLGTPIKEVKARIQTKLHPDTLYYQEHVGGLPGPSAATGGGGKIIWDQWPLGGEHHGKEIVCQIGEVGGSGFWDLPNDVVAYLAFDDKDRLADVFVDKIPDAP